MKTTFHRQRGFNMIELLIGLTLSLLGLAAVGTMMATFSTKRAGIVQTMAAQDNGVMALYRLERDIGQAGYGMMPLVNCAAITFDTNPTFVPYPVVITDGGTASDNITVLGTNPASGVPGTELDITSGTSMTGNQYNVRSSVGFAVNDIVAATNTCTMTTVTSVSATAIGYTPALSSSTSTGYLVYFGAAGEFFNRNYAIGSTAMTVADYPAWSTNNLVDNIVFMKAQYGLSSSTTSTTVTSWVNGATALTSANVARVIAIRVGVVARSQARENEAIDQAATITLLPQILDGGGAEIGAAVSYSIPDTRSRYRAYSTIIPLKNVIWTR
jgi:type IV pilus assembly protein PilW